MNYREIAPSPGFRRHVAAFWRLSSPGPAAGAAGEAIPGEPILPDGRCEIILHRGAPFERDTGSTWERQEATLWAGQLVTPLVLRPAGPTDLFGIRFTPCGAAALLRAGLSETTGAIVPLSAVLPGFCGRLEAASAQSTVLSEFGAEAEAVLEPHLRGGPVDSLAEEAARRLRGRHGAWRVDALAEELGVSRRQLERRFLRAVGLPPKRYARIVRFQHFLATLKEAPPGGGAEVAAGLDYADQPHALREFREFAGVSPTALLADTPRLTAVFAGWTTAG